MSVHTLIDKAMEVCDVFYCQRKLDSCLLHFRCSDFRQRPSVEICSSLCQLTSFSFRSAFHIWKTVSLSFSCVVLLVKTYSFLCCFFFDLPNPFRQVGILDLRADILLKHKSCGCGCGRALFHRGFGSPQCGSTFRLS